jgi:long-chain acyl-CoA synthetase
VNPSQNAVVPHINSRSARLQPGKFVIGETKRLLQHYLDEDGYVFIVDRTKDMLLCGGFNVYPRIIEEAIYQHPGIEEVIVIGIHDDYRGQSPKAFVKLKTNSSAVTLEQMKDFLKDKLGKHEMISALEIRDALPRTAVGKLSKKELCDEETRKRAAQK